MAEKRNKTLLDIVQLMISLVELPKSLWGFSIEIDTYILNRVPRKLDDATSYEIWVSKKPSLIHIRT